MSKKAVFSVIIPAYKEEKRLPKNIGDFISFSKDYKYPVELIFVDDGSGGGTANDNMQNGTEPTIRSGQMPDDVTMFQAQFGANSWFRFDSRGRPNGLGGNVRISNAPANLFTEIRLRITGMPDIRISLDGGANYPDT